MFEQGKDFVIWIQYLLLLIVRSGFSSLRFTAMAASLLSCFWFFLASLTFVTNASVHSIPHPKSLDYVKALTRMPSPLGFGIEEAAIHQPQPTAFDLRVFW
jgi:hypothetical protein